LKVKLLRPALNSQPTLSVCIAASKKEASELSFMFAALTEQCAKKGIDAKLTTPPRRNSNASHAETPPTRRVSRANS